MFHLILCCELLLGVLSLVELSGSYELVMCKLVVMSIVVFVFGANVDVKFSMQEVEVIK